MQESFSPCPVRTQWKGSCLQTRKTFTRNLAGALILEGPAPKTTEKCTSVLSATRRGRFLRQPEKTKAGGQSKTGLRFHQQQPLEDGPGGLSQRRVWRRCRTAGDECAKSGQGAGVARR